MTPIRFLFCLKWQYPPAPIGPIAQLVEHRADNAGVTGAIPVRPTIPRDKFVVPLFDAKNL